MTAELLQIPDALPVLSSGHHKWGSGKACAMDAVSFIQGKPEQGDAPACVHRVLRSAFIRTNDTLPDSRRHELWPLILRAMGTADRAPTDPLEAKRLNVALAVWCARRVSYLVHAQDRGVCEAAIVAAERWLAEPSSAAAADASASADASAAADASASAAAAAASAASASAADAYAYAAAAYAAAAYAYASADASAAADASARLASLAALLDEYDRLTGTTEPVLDIPWDEMLASLGAATT